MSDLQNTKFQREKTQLQAASSITVMDVSRRKLKVKYSQASISATDYDKEFPTQCNENRKMIRKHSSGKINPQSKVVKNDHDVFG